MGVGGRDWGIFTEFGEPSPNLRPHRSGESCVNGLLFNTCDQCLNLVPFQGTVLGGLLAYVAVQYVLRFFLLAFEIRRCDPVDRPLFPRHDVVVLRHVVSLFIELGASDIILI